MGQGKEEQVCGGREGAASCSLHPGGRPGPWGVSGVLSWGGMAGVRPRAEPKGQLAGMISSTLYPLAGICAQGRSHCPKSSPRPAAEVYLV